MLSRVRSREGLSILWPFHLRKIQTHISEELWTELKRTKRLADRTEEEAKEELAWFYSEAKQRDSA